MDLIPSDQLEPARIPAADAPIAEIAEFAMTFDGYEHFGEEPGQWGPPLNAARERHAQTGELPDSLDDLRGVLFLEFRADRFTSFGDETELDGELLVPPPAPERVSADAYKRALFVRIHELIAAAG